jgi:hypothetical protein
MFIFITMRIRNVAQNGVELVRCGKRSLVAWLRSWRFPLLGTVQTVTQPAGLRRHPGDLTLWLKRVTESVWRVHNFWLIPNESWVEHIEKPDTSKSLEKFEGKQLRAAPYDTGHVFCPVLPRWKSIQNRRKTKSSSLMEKNIFWGGTTFGVNILIARILTKLDEVRIQYEDFSSFL